MSADFSHLKGRFKGAYQQAAQEGGPTEQEIRKAFSTLAGAWDQVTESMSIALKDPETRELLKETASSLASALGGTLTDLGAELRKMGDEEEDFAPSPPARQGPG